MAKAGFDREMGNETGSLGYVTKDRVLLELCQRVAAKFDWPGDTCPATAVEGNLLRRGDLWPGRLAAVSAPTRQSGGVRARDAVGDCDGSGASYPVP